MEKDVDKLTRMCSNSLQTKNCQIQTASKKSRKIKQMAGGIFHRLINKSNEKMIASAWNAFQCFAILFWRNSMTIATRDENLFQLPFCLSFFIINLLIAVYFYQLKHQVHSFFNIKSINQNSVSKFVLGIQISVLFQLHSDRCGSFVHHSRSVWSPISHVGHTLPSHQVWNQFLINGFCYLRRMDLTVSFSLLVTGLLLLPPVQKIPQFTL